jgi:hypothetical protein
MLAVSQGTGIRCRDDDGPGGIVGSQIKAGADPGWGIQQDPVVGLSGLLDEAAKNNIVHQPGTGFGGSGEQL